MAILAVFLTIVGTIMMAMSQEAGAMAAQVRKGTIHTVLCQNLPENLKNTNPLIHARNLSTWKNLQKT